MTAEDDTYSTIFTALKHPIRRNILRRLSTSSTTYTELLNELDIENGLLTYHLERMRDLVKKREDGSYTLSEFGRAGLGLIQRVEEPRQGTQALAISYRRAKIALVVLSLCLLSVSGLYLNITHMYNLTQSMSLQMDKTLLVNMSLGELTSRIASLGSGSDKSVLPIISNNALTGVYIPSNVGGYPIKVFGEDELQVYSGYPQHFAFTWLELGSEQATIQIKSIPSTIFSSIPYFGVDLTLSYAKVSGTWQITSIEGGVFPEG